MKTVTTAAITTTAAALLIVGLASPAAQASRRRSLSELTSRLKYQSAHICSDVTDNFRFAPEYPYLSRRARDVYQRAEHLHETTLHRASLRHIERDAYKLAHKIDELETLVHRMKSRRLHTRVSLLPGGRIEYRIGHRYYSRYQLHELAEEIDEMEQTLGELRSLVKSLGGVRKKVHHPVSPSISTPVPPTPVFYRRKSGLSFSLVIR